MTKFLFTDGADLDILAEVDALQSNDELLRTTIFESLRQIHNPEWTGVMKLVFKLLEDRIPISADGSLLPRQPEPLYLRTLSPFESAYTGIISIISHYFEQYILSSLQSSDDLDKSEPHQLYQRALYIFFSCTRPPAQCWRQSARQDISVPGYCIYSNARSRVFEVQRSQ